MIEYRVCNKLSQESLSDFLNAQAAQGWRLIQYVSGEGYIFERDRSEKEPKAMTDKPTTLLVRPDMLDTAMELLESDDYNGSTIGLALQASPEPKPKPKRKRT